MWVALWIALAASVSLEGDGACPKPESVARELGRVLPRELREGRTDRASWTHAGRSVTIELRGGEGTVLAQKTLTLARASCREQARTIAVVLATWESDPELPRPPAVDIRPGAPLEATPEVRRAELPTETGARIAATSVVPPAVGTPGTLVTPAAADSGSKPPATDAGAAATGPSEPSPNANSSVADAGSPAAPPVVASRANATLADAGAAEPPRAVSFAVASGEGAREVVHRREREGASSFSLVAGGGPLATVVNGQVAYGALARVAWAPLDSPSVPWLFVAELSAIGQHSVPLGEGFAVWSRLGVGLGGGLRLRWRWLQGEAYALLNGCWIQLSGEGFTGSQSTSDVNLGLGAAVRLIAVAGRLRPWLALRTDFWLSGQQVAAPPLAKAQQLPMIDVVPALGLDFELL